MFEDSDNNLYLFTSLTAGSSHIVTATATLERILKANKLPFLAIDVATNDVARKLWGRRAKGKKLPGLVKFGTVIGDLEEVEDWNEYGELRMQINSVQPMDSIFSSSAVAQSESSTPAVSTPTTETPPVKQSTIKIQSPPAKETPKDEAAAAAMRLASEEAAAKAKGQSTNGDAKNIPTTTITNTVPAATESKPVEPAATTVNAPVETQDIAPGAMDIPASQESRPKRPPLLVPEIAAESSANIRADAAVVEHHRGSIVSATSPEEQAKVAHDLRKSISGGHQELLNSLREDVAAGANQEETIEEEPLGEEKEEKAEAAAADVGKDGH
ncbi:uncharacterized protein BP01DRAFT_175095 [Aspergillus saccharolyticus JOP 1030-1]|uniref:Thioredoxin-like protein n=1 Tax=Aspergillus saccharolyticus JOP 1030-1 TaxID=1450539 RepID=A0A318ZKD4_9EURO|nr:hypothetical protein BP01DRAFT_175095 [Aspergillus saccharolyticus JOP 1030-1]PYH48019.1 hypothetical protein BP01DRAFT_175095 [Aspergillus saccharolyticus JOP 1030-1]